MYAEDFKEGSDVDEQYFESYGQDLSVTRVMLEDEPRMRFYEHMLRPDVVRGKVVLDVGAGTGVLSLFAARSGARRVVAIEGSSMATLTREVVAENGFSSTVHVVQARAEDVTLASLREQGALGADDDIDIVVSEWMGFYLLHECMLGSVLHVRDHLAPNAQILPGQGSLVAAPVCLRAAQDQFAAQWHGSKIHGGLRLGALARREWEMVLDRNPLVLQLPKECLLCEPQTLATFDFQNKSTSIENTFTSMDMRALFDYANSSRAKSVASNVDHSATLDGFVIWFTVSSNDGSSVLPTGPDDAPTHWKQTVVLLPDEMRGEISLQGLVDGRDIMGLEVHMEMDAAQRSYEIDVGLFDPADEDSDA
eukprot:PhM_4_TR4253/c0_g2_i1/m.64250